MMKAPDPTPPYQQIAPGIYLDANNDPVINIAEMLAHLQVEDTEENRAICTETVLKELARHFTPQDYPTIIIKDQNTQWRPLET